MQKLILLAGTVLIVLVSVVGYRNLTANVAFDYRFLSASSAYAQQQPGETVGSHPRRQDTSEASYANPVPQQQSERLEMEQRILAATVRLVLQRWVKNHSDKGYTFEGGSISLATIRDTHYLVTHNHHGITLSSPEDETLIKAFVSPLHGDPIWTEVRLRNIAVEDDETLVLEFEGLEDEVLFSLPGVEFKPWEIIPLHPGVEVAQVDWDGEAAHIDWVIISEIITTNGTPKLRLNNSVGPGSSGGGVFWNGYHIANTWSQVTAYEQYGRNILRRYNVAALNSPQVSSFPHQPNQTVP
jgi:hypothetical protein